MKTQFTMPYLLGIMLLTVSTVFATNPTIAPPSNDLIENAIDLDSGPFPYSELAINFPEATDTNDATDDPDCSIVQPGIWYKFTANNTGSVTGLIVSPQIPYVVFFSAPNENVTDGVELTYLDVPGNSCAVGASKTIEAEAGTTYYIYVKNAIVSDVLINITPAMVPPNDFIEDARNLNGLEDYLDPDIVFTLATDTNDGGMINCDAEDAKVVWYKFTAATDGQVVAGIGVPQNEGGVIFFSAADENATSGSDLTMVEQPTNTCAPNNLQSIIATAGTTYYIFAALTDSASVTRATVSINLSGILGTEENSLQAFTYYPNPVTNELNLSAKNTIDQVSIFNIMGQKIYAEKINNTNSIINLSFLQQGMYVMTVTSEGTSATYKVVKQ